jgi:branched-chain amino acid transport system substrate-binding protein
MKKIINFFIVFILTNVLFFYSSAPSYGKVVSNKIVLGAAISLSGKYSLSGEQTKNGYDFAVKKINEIGGVKVGGKTYQLEIQYYDDESNPLKAIALAGRLIQHEGIEFLLGNSNLNSSMAVAEEIKKFSVPMIDINTFSRHLLDEHNKYFFTISGNGEENLNLVIDLFSKQNQNSSIAIITEQDKFFQDIKSSLLEKINDYNFNLIFDEVLPGDLNNLKEIIKKTQTLSPDLLIILANSDYNIKVLDKLASLKTDIPMVAIGECFTDKDYQKENINSLTDYIICSSEWHKSLNYQDDIFVNSNNYAKLFEDNYNYKPSSKVVKSSAAVLLYKNALERADSFDKDKIQDALKNTDLMTFFGPIKFNKEGSNIYNQNLLFQSQEKKNKIISPEKFSDGELIFPMPKRTD